MPTKISKNILIYPKGYSLMNNKKLNLQMTPNLRTVRKLSIETEIICYHKMKI